MKTYVLTYISLFSLKNKVDTTLNYSNLSRVLNKSHNVKKLQMPDNYWLKGQLFYNFVKRGTMKMSFRNLAQKNV